MKRKYPVGIQSFEKLRKEGYLYIDKTALVYKMITEGCPYFLSRPRRFGKSLLISTLQAVFEGRRDLFEAFTTEQGIHQPQLYIAQTDWKWEKHPVLRFDFSAGDLASIEQLDTLIDATLRNYEQKYGIVPDVTDTNIRIVNLLRTLHEQTGKRVVVLVDEYDNFILHALGDEEKVTMARQRFQNLFGPLKAEDDHLQFVFITGISKFSQMGIFSKLNNLKNISMSHHYEQICGISEEELTTQLCTDVALLAASRKESSEETLAELKKMYDGYHFSEGMTDIYNPFSLVNAFDSGNIKKFWFDSATPSALFAMLRQMPPLQLSDIDGKRCPDTAFDMPFDNYQDPLPALYQSGYLTIKDYQPSRQMYTLGFPNQEVRTGFADSLYQIVSNTRPDDNGRNIFLEAYYDFRDSGDLPAFIEALKAFFASLPYPWEKDNGNVRSSESYQACLNSRVAPDFDEVNEHYYHSLLYTLLTAFGADVRAEEPTAKGQSDLVLLMPKGIYIMELKYNDTADTALAQIDAKGYADKYALDGRPVTKIGIAFSTDERNISEWKSR